MRISGLLAVVCTGIAWALPAVAQHDALAKAIAGPRSAEFVKRDIARRPQQVLEFGGLKPHMTVLEISPGGGYWTEILGPYLKDSGTYYTTVSPASQGERAVQNAAAWRAKLDANKAVLGSVKTAEFGRGVAHIIPDGSADAVLTFRNIHNWMGAGYAEDAFALFFKALKPGGVLLVEEHRGRTDQPQDPKAATGYVREDYAIALAEQAGFRFVAKSEVLANPRDTKDYPGGVWTLPPTLRNVAAADREKYLAIGEADNFLMKFEKPTE